MDEQQNTAFIQKTYQDFRQGDMESYVNAFDENVQWQLPETGNVPYAGLHRGREQFRQFLDKLVESQEVLKYEPEEFIAKGDKVIVMGKFLGRAKATGEEFELNWIHVYTIRDGKIIHLREYMDTSRQE